MKQITKFLLPILACAAVYAPACAQTWADAPKPPAGAAANQAIPARDDAGNYVTPNRNLSPEGRSWHVRAALNVAALGCRDAAEAETIAAYNGLLARHAAALARADAGLKAEYRARHGASWEDAHDREMTRVYNFFAQPPAQQRFCATAREVLQDLTAVDPDRLADYAAEALPRLEAPFTDFYREYDAYRVAQRGWSEAPATALAVLDAPRTRGPSLP